MVSMTREQFEAELERRLGSSEYARHRWSNYPKSIFYYRLDDYRSGKNLNLCQEIGIYTDENAYGFFNKAVMNNGEVRPGHL